MQSYVYAVAITEVAADDFEVRFRDVPEAVTWGDTRDLALSKAEDCLAAAIEGYIDLNLPLPAPSPAEPGEHLVALDWSVAARALLADAMRRKSLSKVSAGKLLDQDEKAVRRMLKGQNVKLEVILRALKKLGVHVSLSVELTPVATQTGV